VGKCRGSLEFRLDLDSCEIFIPMNQPQIYTYSDVISVSMAYPPKAQLAFSPL
jgi:hypothetical protein